MKILYAIQGTGNGHLSRARDIIPILQKKNIELDILVSGTQADINIPYPITYQLKGLSFIFGKKGGVDFWKTYLKAKTLRLHKEITNLPVENYDLIINDFEPVSAWACKLKQKPCISLSHQSAILTPNAPKPKKKDPLGRLILKKYAPTTKQYGFHFKEYQDNIFTPVIRQDIRSAQCETGEHYTVYLPSYDDKKVINILSKAENVTWQVFSKYCKEAYSIKNITVQPITNEVFVKSMATSIGILCGAGFETPAEALFLRKKLMVIPMKGQYEQQCNAAALRDMGVPVIKTLKEKHVKTIQKWIESDTIVEVDYPDNTEKIIDQLLKENL
ncbi:MAG: glycosyl transferase [Flavobacteriales bacterium]|nr:glycosyl transferase [Flavobacteriia bacterium]NCP06973.1 glycosyl transferase [Flavobacteriales bacterium]PIV93045.1 MAG: glycosyl transferase [Flavobacteriaceae bacterium CG17_big_fil_post_rev_8_21_14_2_50_33_15]PIY10921.1 MAG: glycosyl transferase [Flavobacteriaceae bacterium CG_4_10_14_3_um_filter_33_47]PJB18689.1 MAG: glycosyl transferase [Flavobacteriaceae bacterium CG_4_9_14_3_um_filter_33_16]